MFSIEKDCNFKRDKLETTDVYRENLKASDTVVVVGPSTSIINDTTLLLVSYILGNRGKVYVVDPQLSSDKNNWEKKSKKIGGVITGYGAIDTHLSELNYLRTLGIPLATPEWLGPNNHAQKIELPNNSIDVIADHNTALFITGEKSQDNNARRWQIALSVFKEYARILKIGGTLLFQSHDWYEFANNEGKNIKVLLRQAGIKTERLVVKDNISIPISREIYKKIISWKKLKCQDKKHLGYLYSLPYKLHTVQDNYYLLFDKPGRNSEESIEYWCPNFYVGKK